jgi:DNA invertase Pin-like site-specific DNA recombinase
MLSQATNPPSSRLRVAAQYLRMSTEHQQYSLENQSAAIALYASAHNIGIVRSFTDKGKSGTTISGRSGLQELLRVVGSGDADFELILIYDVSRFGRFPDADEAAHYEYLCKCAGIGIRYCAEQFENDNSTTSNLLKVLKRTMAGEYSRELAVKVRAGQSRLVAEGFRMGGAPYGFQRLLRDKDGKVKQILRPGERKSVQTDRAILLPGDKDEVSTVRRIFDLCTREKQTSGRIVSLLNAAGISFHGHQWGPESVDYVLQNPVYMGTSVYGRNRSIGGHRRQHNTPKETWITREGAFQPIIEPDQFEAAQTIITARRHRFTKKEMLDALRRLWKEHGTLNEKIIDTATGIPTSSTFWHRFGGVVQAYRLIGFKTKRDYSYIKGGHSLKGRRAEILGEITSQIRTVGGSVKPAPFQSICINDGTTARVMFCRPRVWRNGRTLWPLTLKQKRTVDILIAARLELAAPFKILDYFVIPKGAELRGCFHVRKRNIAAFIDLYRTDSLKPFIAACERTSVVEVA